MFDILSGLDLLPRTQQTLPMNVGWLLRAVLDTEWLCFVHKQDEDEIYYQLELSKRAGLLQDVDLRSNRIHMHDSYKEFVRLEMNGSADESTDLADRRWVYKRNGDLSEFDRKPQGGCWQKLIRLAIIQWERSESLDHPDNPFKVYAGVEA